MQFSSRDSADLPWRAGQEVTVHPVILDGKPASVVVRDRPQHNPTSAILATFRRDFLDGEEGVDTLARSWAKFLAEGKTAFTLRKGKREIEHAHRVLTRLAKEPA